MRSLRLSLALGLGALGPALPRAPAAGFNLFHNYWGDVIVATDTTLEGHGLTPPTPENPVYYLGQSLGRRLGSIRGDDEPEVHEMTRFITKILAKQGYLGAKHGVHEPSLYLIAQWGYLDPGSTNLLWFLGYDPRLDIAAPSSVGMLGPEVFRRDFRSRPIRTILDNAEEPNYGIIITAFEYKTVDSKPVIYWQTRIALPANGKSMQDALPTMLMAAGDSIGRESKGPVLRDADEVREGRVKLRDLEILGVVPWPARAPDSGAKK